ncbi:uncharacterized protein LOC106154157 [Lingula anatina]|uniref:Uncharacterized protein LOC106154157 n=1 Tax=Lingula anatina TaxID=7574 RepID=A0A1S3HCV4_LINAN|nr:uncharacterized protein LOC106154157 [Lingula anatina]|eukprot:XP_013383877.1 uncharacterized protein LOC106154157 [Lingula anatina]
MPGFWKPSILILFQGFVFVFMISWERKLTDAQDQPTVCGDMPVVSVREDTLPGTVLLNFTNSSIPGVTDIVIERIVPADGFVSLNISRRAFVLKHAIDAENMTDVSH